MTIRLHFILACVLVLIAANSGQGKPKWTVLFDGKSVSEWRGFRRDDFPGKCWVIEDQSIKTVGGCDKSDQVDIITKQKYKNFELRT